MAKVKSAEKYGFINTKGEWAIEPKFDSIWSYYDGLNDINNGLYLAKKGESFGLIKIKAVKFAQKN